MGALASGCFSALGMSMLVLMLQGCESTPYGQQLAGSFDSQQQGSQASPGSSAPAEAVKTEAIKTDSASSKDRSVETPSEESSNGEITTGANLQKPEASASRDEPKQKALKTEGPVDRSARTVKSQPYRIIIKLSGADPSAPAEAVTEALRKAGVVFEVETIQRVKPSQAHQFSSPAEGDRP